jgi:hypothetical protein
MLLRCLGAWLTGERLVRLSDISADTKALCFDLFATTKADGRDIVKLFSDAACFSMQHGLNVYELAGAQGAGRAVRRAPPRTIAYLYSRHEIPAYTMSYGISESEIKIVGVPRHTPPWVNIILEASPSDVPALWGRYIFIVSRPAITDYLTREKKKRALENIRRVALELDCRIVVKLHPTERVPKNRDNLSEEVFGRDSYGTRWVYASTHPFVLGKKSLFAVVFFSGVAVDMLALGVPTIELLEADAPDIGVATKEMISAYRKRRLVLHADDYEELRAHAFSAVHDRHAAIGSLSPQYREFFGTARDAIHSITNDLCAVLAEWRR